MAASLSSRAAAAVERYLINNPKFVWNIGIQFLGLRKFNIDL